MARTIGIDLGSTNCSVVVPSAEIGAGLDAIPGFPDYAAVIDEAGQVRIPATIALNENNEPVIGERATRESWRERRTVTGLRESLLTGGRVTLAPDREVSAEEACALLLGDLKRRTEECVGESVDGAVVSVPAHAGHPYRVALAEACELAGLELRGTIPEAAAAAAVDHRMGGEDPSRLLVYDLGGAGVDVALLERKGGATTPLSFAGDHRTGGNAIDEILARWIVEKCASEGVHLAAGDSEQAKQQDRLLQLAERAKIRLSDRNEIIEHLEHSGLQDLDGRPVPTTLEITRDEFEHLVSDTVESMLGHGRECISRVEGLEESDIDRVLAVGGTSEMPLVRRRLEEEHGDLLVQEPLPAAWAALGAAVTMQDTETQVTPQLAQDIGIRTDAGIKIVLPAGTPLPCGHTEWFEAGHPGVQENLSFEITEGGRTFGVVDLASRELLHGPFELAFAVNCEQRIEVGLPITGSRSLLETAPSSGRHGIPGGRADLVQFSVTTPHGVCPNSSFTTNVWAHLENQREEVERRAGTAIPEGPISMQSEGPRLVARNSTLTIRLEIEGMIVRRPEKVLPWHGKVGNASFVVTVPRGCTAGGKPGEAIVLLDGAEIAFVEFTVEVAKVADPTPRESEPGRRHCTAFASYAHSDLEAMKARLQGIRTGNPGLDVFWDKDGLRAGDEWEQVLWEEISKRDIFYLFWSEAAARSDWVEKEWKHALQTRGLRHICPVPLAPSTKVDPPPELKRLHFDDKLV